MLAYITQNPPLLATARRTVLDTDCYQWNVSPRPGWDGGSTSLMPCCSTFVAPSAVPTLLGIPLGTTEASSATVKWTGLLTVIGMEGLNDHKAGRVFAAAGLACLGDEVTIEDAVARLASLLRDEPAAGAEMTR